MGAVGETIRRRRSDLRTGITGRILDVGLYVVVAGFLLLLASKVVEHGPDYLEPTMNQPRWLIRVEPARITTWQGVGWHPRYVVPEGESAAIRTGDEPQSTR